MELQSLSKEQMAGYLKRVGFPGTEVPEPTLATLRALHAGHVHSIPYENFTLRNKRLQELHGSEVRLDTDSLYHKFVVNQRGGYCFEMNGLMAAVLKTCGFKMRLGAGRVIKDFDETTPPPDSNGEADEVIQLRGHGHMVIFVEVEDGSIWLEDVGYGGRCPLQPLALRPFHGPKPESELQRNQWETYKLHRLRRGVAGSTSIPSDSMRDSDPHRYGWYMQAKTSQGFRDQYWFMENVWPLEDYETLNWFTQTHPDSYFTNNTIAAFHSPHGRVTLTNNVLKVFHKDDVTVEELSEGPELDAALTKHFGTRFE